MLCGRNKPKEDALQDQVLIAKTNMVSGKITSTQQDGIEVNNMSEIFYCKEGSVILSNGKQVMVSTSRKSELLLYFK